MGRQPQFADQGAGPRPVLPPIHKRGARTGYHTHEHPDGAGGVHVHAPGEPGETRAASGPFEPGHEPLSIVHVHAHGDGHGRVHSHLHSHANDASHSPGGGHPHTPGSPGAGMPEADMNSADPSGEVSGISMAGRIRAFLEAQGVDVDRALADAGYQREHAERAARDRVRVAGDIAFRLRQAKRAATFEHDGWQRGMSGFSLAKVTEARERVSELDAAMREACLDDPEILAEVKRRAGR